MKISSNFSGREEELLGIHRYLSESSPDLLQRAVVLYGLGGIGKTEITLAYASKYRHEYTAVFWIDATDRQTATLGFFRIAQQFIDNEASQAQPPVDYAAIAQRLQLTGLLSTDGRLEGVQGGENGRIVKAAQRWLDTKTNKKWLLIFDNYDDIESYNLVSDFFPETGNILVTSRRKEAAYGHAILWEVETMLEEDGISLLLRTSLGLAGLGMFPTKSCYMVYYNVSRDIL